MAGPAVVPRIAHSQDVPASARQVDLARADSLVRAGRVEQAEAIYFAAARARPRDPAARLALGRYLAARGAWRIGAVLAEEAQRFGADPRRIATMLAPLYRRLEDHAALRALEHAAHPAGEIARADWLRANPPQLAGADSTRVPLFAGAFPASLGAVHLVLGVDTVRAEVDPTVQGIVLDPAMAARAGIRTFGSTRGPASLGVAPRVTIGGLLLRNVPVAFAVAPAGRPAVGGTAVQARIGVDWVGRFAPTFDWPGAMLTLRRAGRPPRDVAAAAERVPLLFELPGADGEPMPGPWLATPGGVTHLGGAGAARLRQGRATIDLRRGELLRHD